MCVYIGFTFRARNEEQDKETSSTWNGRQIFPRAQMAVAWTYMWTVEETEDVCDCACHWQWRVLHWQAFQGEAAAHMLPGGWLALSPDKISFHSLSQEDLCVCHWNCQWKAFQGEAHIEPGLSPWRRLACTPAQTTFPLYLLC